MDSGGSIIDGTTGSIGGSNYSHRTDLPGNTPAAFMGAASSLSTYLLGKFFRASRYEVLNFSATYARYSGTFDDTDPASATLTKDSKYMTAGSYSYLLAPGGTVPAPGGMANTVGCEATIKLSTDYTLPTPDWPAPT